MNGSAIKFLIGEAVFVPCFCALLAYAPGVLAPGGAMAARFGLEREWRAERAGSTRTAVGLSAGGFGVSGSLREPTGGRMPLQFPADELPPIGGAVNTESMIGAETVACVGMAAVRAAVRESPASGIVSRAAGPQNPPRPLAFGEILQGMAADRRPGGKPQGGRVCPANADAPDALSDPGGSVSLASSKTLFREADLLGAFLRRRGRDEGEAEGWPVETGGRQAAVLARQAPASPLSLPASPRLGEAAPCLGEAAPRFGGALTSVANARQVSSDPFLESSGRRIVDEPALVNDAVPVDGPVLINAPALAKTRFGVAGGVARPSGALADGGLVGGLAGKIQWAGASAGFAFNAIGLAAGGPGFPRPGTVETVFPAFRAFQEGGFSVGSADRAADGCLNPNPQEIQKSFSAFFAQGGPGERAADSVLSARPGGEARGGVSGARPVDAGAPVAVHQNFSFTITQQPGEEMLSLARKVAEIVRREGENARRAALGDWA